MSRLRVFREFDQGGEECRGDLSLTDQLHYAVDSIHLPPVQNRMFDTIKTQMNLFDITSNSRS